LIKDKKKVTVKFQAVGGNETPTVFGVRTEITDPLDYYSWEGAS
jgi:hypothetical protein